MGNRRLASQKETDAVSRPPLLVPLLWFSLEAFLFRGLLILLGRTGVSQSSYGWCDFFFRRSALLGSRGRP